MHSLVHPKKTFSLYKSDNKAPEDSKDLCFLSLESNGGRFWPGTKDYNGGVSFCLLRLSAGSSAVSSAASLQQNR